MDAMALNTEYRITEIYSSVDKAWREIPFRELKKGQRFRLFEDNKRQKPVEDAGGSREWTCTKNAVMDPDSKIYFVTI